MYRKAIIKNRILFFILSSSFSFLLVTSCSTAKHIEKEEIIKERIIEKHDTTVVIEGDTAMAGLLIRCDSLGNAYLAELDIEHGKRIKADLQIKSLLNTNDSLIKVGKKAKANTALALNITCREDSLMRIIEKQREYIKESVTQIEKPAPQKYIPSFYKNCTIGFWLLLLIILALLGWHVYKNWSSIARWFVKLWFKL